LGRYHAVRPIRGDERAALKVEGAIGYLRFESPPPNVALFV